MRDTIMLLTISPYRSTRSQKAPFKTWIQVVGSPFSWPNVVCLFVSSTSTSRPMRICCSNATIAERASLVTGGKDTPTKASLETSMYPSTCDSSLRCKRVRPIAIGASAAQRREFSVLINYLLLTNGSGGLGEIRLPVRVHHSIIDNAQDGECESNHRELKDLTGLAGDVKIGALGSCVAFYREGVLSCNSRSSRNSNTKLTVLVDCFSKLGPCASVNIDIDG